MGEIKLVFNRHDNDGEMIDESHLALIGCVDLGWDEDNYPLPIFAIDGKPEIRDLDYGDLHISRVQGLSPFEFRPGVLLRGAWAAAVDLEQGARSGSGSVYLGGHNDTTGQIFDTTVPYNPECELAYVENPAHKQVLLSNTFKDRLHHLIYAPHSETVNLGRFSLRSLWLDSPD